jgi:hypothetical protein
MKHCYRCKKCVHKYDHHCVLLNICIGEANQKYYILFLWMHFANTVYVLGQLLVWIKGQVSLDHNGIEHLTYTYYLQAVFIILMTLNFILTIYLVFIHTQFLFNGLTTY